ncbi:hypothetical protein DYB25_000040 [Aphanomyces astaci]|uniref:ADF-H domain-containing protein n=1 Tax=Aphanomyces astaci TaxID=112090 RepID=A0A397F409_APHAT|nr:hypothetical protein DYB25_000040 [Aphanomyces astaci]RHY40037.1 hypothetical protein DYB38_002206 [Aphanomyces astaci]RHY43622.1 hypothetical protein DYB34_001857 [Aphanomyces astaci]RHY78555.1 hypothetical protein DYB30_000047 [Aphanomyces astaci]RHZ14485.1 hypothetical protein DYB31_004377 [Aphanomyces astaci]
MNGQVLRVSEPLATQFQAAQETNTVRCIEAKVTGEQLVVNKVFQIHEGVQADAEWASIQAECSTPSLVLFHIATSNGPLKWILVAYVCDTLPARDKMLYASARDCLKQQLGLAYFVGDVHTTNLSAFTYRDVVSTMHTTTGPLSDREVLLKEEALLERDLSVKSSAMNVLPFGMSAACDAALIAFSKKGTSSTWLSMRMTNEELVVDASVQITRDDQINALVDKEQPSFVLYRSLVDDPTPTTFFVYICPEAANVRFKMTYSTAKASLLHDLQRRGILVDSTVRL